MNILVLSDSHGDAKAIMRALALSRPQAVIFLGDGLRDVYACDIGDTPLYAVCGNCDLFFGGNVLNEPAERIADLGGKRIFMTHGHAYSVKSHLGELVRAAVAAQADVVLFGHTHARTEIYLPTGDTSYGVTLQKPMWIFNPGSAHGYGASFGNILIQNGNVLLSHGSL